jgi:hypothetical protein
MERPSFKPRTIKVIAEELAKPMQLTRYAANRQKDNRGDAQNSPLTGS